MRIKEIYRGLQQKEAKSKPGQGSYQCNRSMEVTVLPKLLFYRGNYSAGVVASDGSTGLVASDESVPDLRYKHVPQDLS